LLRALAVLLSSLALAAPAAALSLSFTRVADTSTAIPGGAGSFTQLLFPAIDQGRVAFFGQGTSSQQGLYTWAGGPLRVLADRSTPVPGGGGSGFSSFGDFAVDGGSVAFTGSGGGVNGAYVGVPGGATPTAIADTATAIPGVYTGTGGALATVADTGTAIPGGTGNFVGFNNVGIADGSVAFVGSGGTFQQGIYSDRAGALAVVADTSTPEPGGSGSFFPFGFNASIDAVGRVAFRAGTPAGSGIYVDDGSTLRRVADQDTPIPDGTGRFGFAIGNPAVDGEVVLFRGAGAGGQDGVYVEIGGQLFKVLAAGDALDGRIVDFVNIDTDSLSGLDVALRAVFTDGSEGIYVTSIPEPSAGGLLAAGLGVLAARRRVPRTGVE
jgi:hypothetical protein